MEDPLGMGDEMQLRPPPEISETINALEHHLRERAGDVARITPGALNNGWIRTLHVEPHNLRSRVIDIAAEQFLLVQIGDEGGRFELGYEADDLDHAKRLINAVVHGRVTQRNAVGRSIVTVVHEDGTTESETGITGCASLFVPQPGWRAWGRVERYEPYRPV